MENGWKEKRMELVDITTLIPHIMKEVGTKIEKRGTESLNVLKVNMLDNGRMIKNPEKVK